MLLKLGEKIHLLTGPAQLHSLLFIFEFHSRGFFSPLCSLRDVMMQDDTAGGHHTRGGGGRLCVFFLFFGGGGVRVWGSTEGLA